MPKQIRRDGKLLSKVVSHSDALRALTGEE
jgi:hypothetical protein